MRMSASPVRPCTRRPAAGLWRNRAHYPGLNEEADAVLAQVGLLSRRSRAAASLAHGEQRALEIAVALASRPKLLLLDEPTAGMSPEETKEMMALIARLAADRTVLLVEHKMKMVMGLADRIVVLHQGKLLASGTPDEIRADASVPPRLSRRRGGPAVADPLLQVRDLNAWYGQAMSCKASALRWDAARSSRLSAATAPARRRRCERSWA